MCWDLHLNLVMACGGIPSLQINFTKSVKMPKMFMTLVLSNFTPGNLS